MGKKDEKEEKSLVLKDISDYKNLPLLMAGQWGGCARCPISDYCEKATTLTDIEKKAGCGEIKNLLYENAKLYSKPELVLKRTLVDIDTRLQIQSVQDGKKMSTKEFKQLLDMKHKFLNLAFKYYKGTVHTQISIKKEEEGVIPVDIRSYESQKREEGKDETQGNGKEGDGEKVKTA